MSSLSSFLLGPNNPQQVTSSSSTSSTLPTWLTQYSQGLLGAASGLTPQTVSNLGSAQSPISAANPYLGSAQSTLGGALNPSTSGLALAQPGISQASGIVGNAINPANSGLTAAQPYINQADQGTNNTALMNSYMSPYLSDVTGYNTQLANQNLQQNVIPAVESQSIANGQFGSSPMGTALGQQIDLTQQNLQAQNLAAANTGYQEAGQLAESDLARQGTLGQLAGTLGTQQQGAELQGASTLGSLSGELGSLGTGEQQIGLSGASTLGSLGNEAGTLTGTGNSEQLSQLGLLGSLTGTPGGSTTTQNNSYPNPYSLAQVAGSGSSSLANLLTGLTGSNSGGVLGQTSSLASLLGGSSATNAANTNLNNIVNGYSSSPDLGSSLTSAPAPDFSTANMGLPSYFSMYHSGGMVDHGPKPAVPRVADHWYAAGGHVQPTRPFMAADGGAVQLPTFTQDMSLSSSPNAIFTPGETGSYSYAPSQEAAGLPSMTALPAVSTGTTGNSTSSLAGALGSLLGASSASSGIGSPSAVSSSPGASVTPGQVIGGLGAANSAANTVSSLAGDGALTSPMVGTALGAVGAGLGLVSAIEHPGNPQSDVGGAVDAYKLYNSGSSLLGGGAGSTSGTALTAADLAEPAPDLASITTPDVSSLLSGTADVGADTGGATAAGASGAGSGALGAISSLGSVAVPLANAAVLGEVINGIVQGNQRGPPLTFNPMAGLTQNPEGKLGSGNSIAVSGDIGYGEGNNEAQGSGQLYRVNPDGSAANNTAYDWLGQGATNQADQAYTDYESSLKPAGSGGPSPFGLSTGPVNNPAADLANSNTAYSSLFNSTGGAQAWGMSEADFQNQMLALAGDANANGGNGLLLGVT